MSYSNLNLFSPLKVTEWDAHLSKISKMYADTNPFGVRINSGGVCSASDSIAKMRFFGYDKIDQLIDLEKSVGSGQCAALIQHYVTGIGLAKTWRPGPRVADLSSSSIPRGTVIATFWNGKYPNESTGNHVAFYLSHNTKIIEVVEQWSGVNAKQARAARTAGGIRFKGITVPTDQSGPKPKMTNTAEYYHVVLDKR